MKRLDIAIVGAGPGGMASALLLSRLGHRVGVFERFETPRAIGSGLILQPTGMAVIDLLGLGAAIRQRGTPIRYIDGRDAASLRPVLAVRYDALAGGPCGHGIHRGALFDLLFGEVDRAGIGVETGREVVDVEDASTTGRKLVFVDGRRSGRYDLVVDASGARSALLRHAQGAWQRRELAYGALWASLDWRDGPCRPDTLTQRYERASVMIGVLPIGRLAASSGDMAAFFWSLKPAEYPLVKSGGLTAWKQRVGRYWPEAQAYLDQIESWEQLTLARYGHHTLSHPAGRGIAFVGDCAHSTSPQLGQGANMALLDAATLAASLAEYDDLDQALGEYCRGRRLHVRLFQALSWLLTPFYQSDSAALAWVRDRLAGPASVIPPGPQILAAMVAGTLGWSGPPLNSPAFRPV